MLTEDDKEAALGLQRSELPKLFGAREVLIFEDGDLLRFAFRGSAERIEAVTNREDRDGQLGMLPNRDHRLDVDLQRAVGYDAHLARRTWGYEIVGGLGQTIDQGDAHYAQVLDALGTMLGERLGREAVVCSLMPAEGHPWSPKAPDGWTAHFNARTRRTDETSVPGWLTEVRVRAEDLDFHHHHGVPPGQYVPVRGADLCSLAPVIERAGGAVLERLSGVEFLVSHSFDPRPWGGVDDPRPWAPRSHGRRAVLDAAELVRRCGGWVFPSVAVGKFASTAFGPVTLLAGSDLILDGLKPRRGRGRRSVSLYDTDVWTPNTRDILGLGAHVLYEQLCGLAPASIYTNAWVNHQWTLGPPVRLSGPSGPSARLIESDRQLLTALRARYREWREDLSDDEVLGVIERASESEDGFQFSVHRYPYMEAKINAVVRPTVWQLACVAESWAFDAERFLDAVGFEGTMLVVADPPGASYDQGWDLNIDPSRAYQHSLELLQAVRSY